MPAGVQRHRAQEIKKGIVAHRGQRARLALLEADKQAVETVSALRSGGEKSLPRRIQIGQGVEIGKQLAVITIQQGTKKGSGLAGFGARDLLPDDLGSAAPGTDSVAGVNHQRRGERVKDLRIVILQGP